ncbi:hypothetical protein D3C86_2225280 [compost metagenome]
MVRARARVCLVAIFLRRPPGVAGATVSFPLMRESLNASARSGDSRFRGNDAVGGEKIRPADRGDLSVGR